MQSLVGASCACNTNLIRICVKGTFISCFFYMANLFSGIGCLCFAEIPHYLTRGVVRNEDLDAVIGKWKIDKPSHFPLQPS